jgi:transposase
VASSEAVAGSDSFFRRRDADPDDDAVMVAAHLRKKRGRQPLPEYLLRIDIIHELPESERRCDHDGRTFTEIDEVISVQLDIVPATTQVISISAEKYACGCGHCI